jgi:hypothetical protein
MSGSSYSMPFAHVVLPTLPYISLTRFGIPHLSRRISVNSAVVNLILDGMLW